jgi:uncharacterized protein (DUF1697 family)
MRIIAPVNAIPLDQTSVRPNTWLPPMMIHIALIRAIGPETHRRMPLSALIDACGMAGLEDIASFAQTGNLVIRTKKSAEKVGRLIEKSICGFGLDNAVFVRSPAQIVSVIEANPFSHAARLRPARLVACFLDRPPEADAVRELEKRRGREKIACVNGELVIDYADGITGSKVAPGVVERVLRRQATARNWNTLTRLVALAQ